ncbi:MAG: DUF1127 domain-containing protein [Alphaproteobacteria bacterium]|nr:DUF1127 domain-containing protein [Alphaproteobacteria bacterium]MCW5742536.1 DUF1127 domain-containing protein [Alphaproteobacteria bacterium]
MRDHPTESILSRVTATLALWRKRSRERAEIARLSVRDARDLGINPGSLVFEASKPFWRA